MSNTDYAITEQMANAINSHLSIPTGPVRLLTIRSGAIFELRVPGGRLTGKAPKCSTILGKEFGIKGNAVKRLAIFEDLLQQVGILQPGDVTTVLDDGKRRVMTRDEKHDFDSQREAA